MERAPAGLEKHLHAIGVVDVTTAELDAGLRLELAGVADGAELSTGRQTRAGLLAVLVKAGHEVVPVLTEDAVASVATRHNPSASLDHGLLIL